MNTAPTTAIAEYSPIEAALATVEKYRGLVCDVTTPKGMTEAKAAHREVAAIRIALEKTRKKVKEDVIARGKLIDGEANRIFALVAAIEDPIKVQIEAEERRDEEKRQATIKAEEERIAAAERARKAAEEAELARQRAQIEAERAALAKAQASARESEERARLAREEEARQHRAKMAEEERAAKKRIDDAEREAKAQRQAEEDRLRAESERLEAERNRLAEAARAEQFAKDEAARAVRLEEQRKREAEENERANAERERLKKIADLADGQQVLALFVDRFGHVEQFKGVVAAIKEYQRPVSKARRKAA